MRTQTKKKIKRKERQLSGKPSDDDCYDVCVKSIYKWDQKSFTSPFSRHHYIYSPEIEMLAILYLHLHHYYSLSPYNHRQKRHHTHKEREREIPTFPDIFLLFGAIKTKEIR